MNRALLLGFLLLWGCSETPPAERVVLGADRRPESPGSTASPPVSVLEVTDVELPDWLDTTDIVMDTRSGTLDVARNARWAERLSAGVSRVLALELQERFVTVDVSAGKAVASPDFRLITQVVQIGCNPEACRLDGRWAVVDRQDRVVANGRVVRARQFEAYLDPRKQAEAIESDVSALADDIQLKTLTRFAPTA